MRLTQPQLTFTDGEADAHHTEPTLSTFDSRLEGQVATPPSTLTQAEGRAAAHTQTHPRRTGSTRTAQSGSDSHPHTEAKIND